MHAVIPLLFVFLLFNSEQLKTDKLYRANIFALVGASYFCVLQYSIYWYQVFLTQSLLQYLPGLLAVLASIAIALSKWNKRSHPIKTLFICCLFGLSLIASFGFDKQIKEKLAEMGGYFEGGDLAELAPPISISEDSQEVNSHEFTDIGLSMMAPADWQTKTLSSGHQYLVKFSADNLLLELRPNCLGEVEVDTPTFVKNTIALLEGGMDNNQVYHACSNRQTKSCLIKVIYGEAEGKIKERWHWLQLDGANPYLVDLVFFDASQEIKSAAWRAMMSTKPIVGIKPNYCTTPSVWL